MECKFVVGQKVVCVDDRWPLKGDGYGNEVGPKNDVIYTVREIFLHEVVGKPCFLLEEIRNPAALYKGIPGPSEAGFGAYRFRPAIDFQSLCDVKREREFTHDPR